MKRRGFFKLGLIFITTGALTGICLVAMEGTTSVALDPTPTAIPTATADVPLMVVVPDGQILFYDEPNGKSKPYYVPEETILYVRILEERKSEDGTEWFLLDLTEIEGRGWVKSEELVIRVDGGLTPTASVIIDSFQFCLGTAAGPSGPCGTSLALPSDELWLQYRFNGLHRGAVLQTVIEIDGEKFQSPPTVWDRAGNGEQLVNLIGTHNLPMRPGKWKVYFYVDQRLVSDASVTIRPQ